MRSGKEVVVHTVQYSAVSLFLYDTYIFTHAGRRVWEERNRNKDMISTIEQEWHRSFSCEKCLHNIIRGPDM